MSSASSSEEWRPVYEWGRPVHHYDRVPHYLAEAAFMERLDTD